MFLTRFQTMFLEDAHEAYNLWFHNKVKAIEVMLCTHLYLIIPTMVRTQQFHLEVSQKRNCHIFSIFNLLVGMGRGGLWHARHYSKVKFYSFILGKTSREWPSDGHSITQQDMFVHVNPKSIIMGCLNLVQGDLDLV